MLIISRIYKSFLLFIQATGLCVILISPAISEESTAPLINQKSLNRLIIEHKKIVAEYLALTPEEAKGFWPIYERYRMAVLRLIEERMKYIKELAQSYESIDDQLSLNFIDHFRKIDHGTDEVWATYMPKFLEVIGPKKTARFYQIERRIRIYLDAETSRALPLLK